jgi:hypothetical protein
MNDKKAIPLRISPELYTEIRAWAEQDLRSVNSQIELILRDAVAHRKSSSKSAAEVRKIRKAN